LKKGIQKWIAKNKKLLIVFGIISLITMVLTTLEISLIISSTNDLESYVTTGNISNELRNVGLLGLLNVALIAAWTICFSIILICMIFPSQKTVNDAFLIDELNFLKNIPNQLKRGLEGNE